MNPPIIGRYEIIRELGRGGMAVVYLARDPLMKREVAVKVIQVSQNAGDTDQERKLAKSLQARFEREAQIVATLEHPAIVPVYDYGISDGCPFIVMRYMLGGTLKDRIETGVLSPIEAKELLGQLAPAVDKAHQKGIIHRDLKPGNILFDEDGNAYIADFGIAKVVDAAADLTKSETVGTWAYMSPEQAKGETLDGRSDIYSLGVIYFEMLTGRLPFDAETPPSMAVAHIMDPVPNILEYRSDLDHTYKVLIERVLAKDPDERLGTAAEFVDALGGDKQVPQTGTDDQALEKLYDDGLAAYWMQDWQQAKQAFENILSRKPTFRDVQDRLSKVDDELACEALYEAGQQAFEFGEWRQAEEILAQLLDKKSDYKNAQALLEEAQKQNQLADLLSQAQRLFQAAQWGAVLRVFEQIKILESNYPDPENLLSKAQEKLSAQEKEAQLDTWYRHGLQALDNQEWEAALALFKQIEAEAPGYRENAGLIERINAEIDQIPRKNLATQDVPEHVVPEKPLETTRKPQTIPSQPEKPARVFPGCWLWIGALLGVILIVAACGISLNAFFSNRASSPTENLTDPDTNLAAVVPEQTDTGTPAFTLTMKPTDTAALTPTPTPTNTPKPSDTPSPTATARRSTNTSEPEPEETIIYQHDFSFDDGKWSTSSYTGEWGTSTSNLVNGKYRISLSVSQSSNYQYRYCLKDLNFDNFALSVEATLIERSVSEPSVYGVVFRRQGSETKYYEFRLNDRSRYKVNLRDDDYTALVDWTDAAVINNNSTNKIEIIAVDSALKFSVNDQVLAEITDDTWSQGRICFFIRNEGKQSAAVDYDNLVIKEVP